jgi:filamentous hemagglutinin
LQGIVNTVPGAYYAGLAQEQFRRGNYDAAAIYEALAFGDAALGAATLGASTRLGTGIRAAETALTAESVAADRAAAVAAKNVAPVAEEAGAIGGKLPTDSAGSVAKKLDTYLLDLDHADGGPKAEWFKRSLGFTRENAADLAKQLVFDESQAVKTEVTQYGTKFNQVINVTGANGRTIPIRTIWNIGSDGVPRLVTALPRS